MNDEPSEVTSIWQYERGTEWSDQNDSMNDEPSEVTRMTVWTMNRVKWPAYDSMNDEPSEVNVVMLFNEWHIMIHFNTKFLSFKNKMSQQVNVLM